MRDITYSDVILTDQQVEKAARAVVEETGGHWDTTPEENRYYIRTDAVVAVTAVLPEILNAHTALLLSRLARAKAVHDQWAGGHHDSDTHQLLAELHQALFGGES